MMTHTHPSFPPAHPQGIAARAPDARWPLPLLDLYRTAYRLHTAVQMLWQLAQTQQWRDEALTHAYHTAFDALDQVEMIAAPLVRAWEADHA